MKRLTLLLVLLTGLALTACNPFASDKQDSSGISLTESRANDVQYVLKSQMSLDQFSVTTDSIKVEEDKVLVIEFIQASVSTSGTVRDIGLFLELDDSTVFVDSLSQATRGTTLQPPDHFGLTSATKFLVGSGQSVAATIHRRIADKAEAEVSVVLSGRLIRAK